MEILFVSTELAPYAKVGGLADVAQALPKALRSLGHKVTMLLPRYPGFEEGGLSLARRLTPIVCELGGKKVSMTVYDGRLPSQIDLILVDVEGFYSRNAIYGEKGEDYPDNAERFAALSIAAGEIAKLRADEGRPFDVIHANDWPTALAPLHAKRAGFAGKTVLTIHNIAHQGIFPKDALPKTGLTWDDFTPSCAEFYGSVNLLKAGILAADVVTTVSDTYANEIRTEAGGHRLDGVVREKGALVGILNGIDYSIWNPATDSVLAGRFDGEDQSNKARCKGALQKELGLPLDVDAPLVISVGRLDNQKGSDLVAEMLPKLLRGTNAQVVLAGDGEPALVAAYKAAVEASDGRAVFAQAASEALVHRIFAAGDIALVPSRFEPCGLVQMYAQRYGALPVAHRTGGIVDTVVDCDAHLETGTGFLFEEATASALLGATERALSAMRSPAWRNLVRRVMRLDRAWERAARKYEQVYKPSR